MNLPLAFQGDCDITPGDTKPRLSGGNSGISSGIENAESESVFSGKDIFSINFITVDWKRNIAFTDEILIPIDENGILNISEPNFDPFADQACRNRDFFLSPNRACCS
ncbi:MAG: hypothetical protein V4507_15970 [Verrucomicrobiota bacterium]